MKKIKTKHILIALVVIAIIYYFYKKRKATSETKTEEVKAECNEGKMLELTAEEQEKLSKDGYIFNKMMIIDRPKHDKAILEKRKKCGYTKDVVVEYKKKHPLNK